MAGPRSSFFGNCLRRTRSKFFLLTRYRCGLRRQPLIAMGRAFTLNLSDCAAYALAKTLDAPLLYKGEDFTATDVQRP